MVRIEALACALGLLAACKPGETSTPAGHGGSVIDEPVAAHEPTSAHEPRAAEPVAEDTTEPESKTVAVGESEGGQADRAAALPAPLHKKVDSSCGRDPGVGQRLRPFQLHAVDGKQVTPASFRGRVLLVNFWGTWCKPCLQELPEFDQLYRRYRKHGLTLVAIATDEEPAAVQAFAHQRKIAARLLIGGESYASQYAADKFPFSFVVDERGVIRSSFRGYKPECAGKIEADIRAALEQRNSAP